MKCLLDLITGKRKNITGSIDYRPVFIVESAIGNVTALYDTGAFDSVWCDKEWLFIQHFPDAKKIEERTVISGFGGDSEYCPIYIVPLISVGDLNLRNIPIVIHPMNFPFSLILQNDAFKVTRLAMDISGRKLVLLDCSRDTYFKTMIDKDGKYCGSVVFAQEEDNKPISETNRIKQEIKKCADVQGISYNTMLMKVFNSIPTAEVNFDKSIFDNVKIWWDTYKKFL